MKRKNLSAPSVRLAAISGVRAPALKRRALRLTQQGQIQPATIHFETSGAHRQQCVCQATYGLQLPHCLPINGNWSDLLKEKRSLEGVMLKERDEHSLNAAKTASSAGRESFCPPSFLWWAQEYNRRKEPHKALLALAKIGSALTSFEGKSALLDALAARPLEQFYFGNKKLRDVEVAYNALANAWQQGCQKVFKLCVDQGIALNSSTAAGNTMLHLCASLGDRLGVQALLDLGADVRLINGHGQAAVHVAVAEGHMDCFEVLFSAAGCDLQADQNGNTVLHLAAVQEKSSTLQTLLAILQASVSPQAFGQALNTRNKAGATAVFEAAQWGCAERIKELAHEGADLNQADKNGMTPLHVLFLLGSGQWPCSAEPYNVSPAATVLSAFYLLVAGADINAINNAQDTPVHSFLRSNKRWEVELMELALHPKYHLNLGAKNADGQTLLHVPALISKDRTCSELS